MRYAVDTVLSANQSEAKLEICRNPFLFWANEEWSVRQPAWLHTTTLLRKTYLDQPKYAGQLYNGIWLAGNASQTLLFSVSLYTPYLTSKENVSR
jgi:hypothetical protein